MSSSSKLTSQIDPDSDFFGLPMATPQQKKKSLYEPKKYLPEGLLNFEAIDCAVVYLVKHDSRSILFASERIREMERITDDKDKFIETLELFHNLHNSLTQKSEPPTKRKLKI